MPVIKTKLKIGILLVVVLAYLAAFLIFPKPGETPGPGDFGTFGDFVGGMLNPLLSFASFMAVLYTLAVQRDEAKSAEHDRKQDQINAKAQLKQMQREAELNDKARRTEHEIAQAQLRQMREEAELNEINRIMKANEEELDRVLSIEVTLKTGNDGNSFEGPFENFFNMIYINYNEEDAKLIGLYLQKSQFTSRIFIWTGELLTFINDCLTEYSSIKNNSFLVQHYQHKYMRIARPMFFLGYIDRENVSMLLSENDLGTEPLSPFLM